eukprot:389184-Prymnesium_polylepis.1
MSPLQGLHEAPPKNSLIFTPGISTTAVGAFTSSGMRTVAGWRRCFLLHRASRRGSLAGSEQEGRVPSWIRRSRGLPLDAFESDKLRPHIRSSHSPFDSRSHTVAPPPSVGLAGGRGRDNSAPFPNYVPFA